ncbi:hypothetical protein [Rathayibacter tanaceti]|uniref:hypothetical protein n=1 Tax=Rathayibacter tanaceti TaxID=1671680 RepID=UPI0012903E34|nr:hypothetical protein [Rathayibacter tanaceti]
MSSFDDDTEPTLSEDTAEGAERTPDPATETGTAAGLDEVGGASDALADGVGADGEEQNPPLPDWAPPTASTAPTPRPTRPAPSSAETPCSGASPAARRTRRPRTEEVPPCSPGRRSTLVRSALHWRNAVE